MALIPINELAGRAVLEDLFGGLSDEHYAAIGRVVSNAAVLELTLCTGENSSF
jgi:hypothetical protein